MPPDRRLLAGMYSACLDEDPRRQLDKTVTWLKANRTFADVLLGRSTPPAVWATRAKWAKQTVIHLTEADAEAHAQRQADRRGYPVKMLEREDDQWALRRWVQPRQPTTPVRTL